MVAAVVVPVVGNWVRAYMIVMIGHLTKNKFGLGADHILFGWVFFGILIYILFSIGAHWREDHDHAPKSEVETPPFVPTAQPQSGPEWVRSLVCVVLACLAPPLVAMTASDPKVSGPLAPIAVSGWTLNPVPAHAWRPQISGARGQSHDVLLAPDGRGVVLYRGVFAGQRGEARMIRFGNEFLPKDFIGESSNKERTIVLQHAGEKQSAREIEVQEGPRTRVVRGAYVVQGKARGSAYWSKLALAQAQLTGRGDTSAMIVWSAADRDAETARATLSAFEAAMGPKILQAQ
jgi:EpsI family protein